MHSNTSVSQAIHSICNLSMRHLTPVGENITHMQGAFIVYIINHGDNDVFQRDIEKKFNIRRSTATGILKLMEKNGYIVRESVNHDKRLKKIILTEKAIAFNNEIQERLIRFENILKQNISKEELDVFFSVTEKMIKNLQ